MRGRYIGDNIRNILEIIETVEEEDLSFIMCYTISRFRKSFRFTELEISPTMFGLF